jgi:DNA-binding PadR family transcriptional regulator
MPTTNLYAPVYLPAPAVEPETPPAQLSGALLAILRQLATAPEDEWVRCPDLTKQLRSRGVSAERVYHWTPRLVGFGFAERKLRDGAPRVLVYRLTQAGRAALAEQDEPGEHDG